jgi:hypothetical protein
MDPMPAVDINDVLHGDLDVLDGDFDALDDDLVDDDLRPTITCKVGESVRG